MGVMCFEDIFPIFFGGDCLFFAAVFSGVFPIGTKDEVAEPFA